MYSEKSYSSSITRKRTITTNIKIVWRQLELAFFGAVTSVAALFIFELLEVKMNAKFKQSGFKGWEINDNGIIFNVLTADTAPLVHMDWVSALLLPLFQTFFIAGL